jgi:hypothetical protein
VERSDTRGGSQRSVHPGLQSVHAFSVRGLASAIQRGSFFRSDTVDDTQTQALRKWKPACGMESEVIPSRSFASSQFLAAKKLAPEPHRVFRVQPGRRILLLRDSSFKEGVETC